MMPDCFDDTRIRCQEMVSRPPDGDPKSEAARWREVARLAMVMAHEFYDQYQKTISLVIPGDVVRDLSPNKKQCAGAKMRKTKWWRGRVQMEWWALGRPKLKTPVAVKFIVRRGRVVDQTNAVGALKAVEDGLWGPDSLLPSDSQRCVSSCEVIQQTGGRWALFPEVEILITGEPA